MINIIHLLTIDSKVGVFVLQPMLAVPCYYIGILMLQLMSPLGSTIMSDRFMVKHLVLPSLSCVVLFVVPQRL